MMNLKLLVIGLGFCFMSQAVSASGTCQPLRSDLGSVAICGQSSMYGLCAAHPTVCLWVPDSRTKRKAKSARVTVICECILVRANSRKFLGCASGRTTIRTGNEPTDTIRAAALTSCRRIGRRKKVKKGSTIGVIQCFIKGGEPGYGKCKHLN